MSQSVERKTNKSSGNRKQNQERSAIIIPIEKNDKDLHSCKPSKSGEITLTAYLGKVNKHVLMFSTMHNDITIANNAKKTPETVSSYNETKYGVDIVDQMSKKYTCRTGTRRWPMHGFQNTLDLAAINAWILHKKVTHDKISRKKILSSER